MQRSLFLLFFAVTTALGQVANVVVDPVGNVIGPPTVNFPSGTSVLKVDGITVLGGGGGGGGVVSILASTPIVVSPDPITNTGTISLDPTTKTTWDTAYAERLQWNGGSTNLDAVSGRTSLGLGTAALADASAFESPLTFRWSIVRSLEGAVVNLAGDASAPGNDKYYGTNASGTKGFFDLPTGGGGSPVSLTATSPLIVTPTPLTGTGVVSLDPFTKALWDQASTDRLKWDGGPATLTASIGRTSLGAQTVGSNIFTLTDPNAITFLKINANNTVVAESAATFRTSLGVAAAGSNGNLQFNSAGAFGAVGTANYVGGELLLSTVSATFIDGSDPTKRFKFSTSNIPSSTTETVLIPNSVNPVVVASDAGATNNFLTGITALGQVTKAQPSFSNLSGSIGATQNFFPIGNTVYVDAVSGTPGGLRGRYDKPCLTITQAIALAQAGDVIYVGPGTFTENTGIKIPNGVSLYGAGAGLTTITSSLSSTTKAVVNPGNNSIISDVTINASAANGVPLGALTSDPDFANATVSSCVLTSLSDGVKFTKAAGTSSLTISYTTVSTNAAAVANNVGTVALTLYSVDMIADGNASGNTYGLVSAAGTTRVYNSTVQTLDASSENIGVNVTGGAVEIHGLVITTDSSGATFYDLSQTAGTLEVENVTMSTGTAPVTNGAITQLSRYALRDNNLSDLTDLAAARGILGLDVGTDIQAWDAQLQSISGLSYTGNALKVLRVKATEDDFELATVSAGASVSDVAYPTGWDTDTTGGASRNALRDYFVLFDSDQDGKVNALDQVAGITNTDSSGVVQTPITAPAGAVVGTTDTQTLTNKRVTKRTSTEASSATPTINTDNVDLHSITALAANVTSMSTNLSGTPTEGQTLVIWMKDDGTPRTIAWGTSFLASTDLALPTTTSAGKVLYTLFTWNSLISKWLLMAKLDNFTNPISLTAGSITASNTDASSYVSGSFTPTAGSLVAVAVVASSTDTAVSPGTMTSTDGTFTLVESRYSSSASRSVYLFICDQLATGSSMTVTFDCSGDQAGSADIQPFWITGMTKLGATAKKQSTDANTASGATPGLTFSGSVLTGNPTILVLGNVSSPAGVTEPTGWTETGDGGATIPTTGIQTCTRLNGFTGTSVTWGSTSSLGLQLGVEIDTSP